MLFSSWEFICVFLVLVLGVLNRLPGLQAKLAWLTICSYIFYGFAGPQYTLLLLSATIVDYNVGKRLAATDSVFGRKSWVALSLTVNLGMLAVFKYANFLWRNVLELLTVGDGLWGTELVRAVIYALQYESLTDAQTFMQVVLPPGISFYTFQSLSYTLDVYRNKTKPEPQFWKFACFVSLFPQLIAGPIVRYVELAPQLETGLLRTKTVADWECGVLQFSVGLCKKVLIADRIGNAIDPFLGNYHQLDMVGSWVVMIGFAYQLYFDFSGYSDMAIGLGRLLGFKLPINFDSPYRAVNPSDFWSRWHVTLSRWMRDYVYISLGGNRGGRLLTVRNLFITMFLGGLWHGAAWTFVVWGAFHGILLAFYHGAKSYWDRIPPVRARGLMFALIVFSWVPFRSADLRMTKEILLAMFGSNGFMSGSVSEMPPKLFLALAVAGALAHTCRTNSNHIRYEDLGNLRVATLAAATVGALVYMNVSSKFLYFNF
ncbi:MAG: MBOAT family protein [Nitrospirae bacterium]|nr:MAG: MBOAT family protein [Nitrospirota bacterium]